MHLDQFISTYSSHPLRHPRTFSIISLVIQFSCCLKAKLCLGTIDIKRLNFKRAYRQFAFILTWNRFEIILRAFFFLLFVYINHSLFVIENAVHWSALYIRICINFHSKFILSNKFQINYNRTITTTWKVKYIKFPTLRLPMYDSNASIVSLESREMHLVHT